MGSGSPGKVALVLGLTGSIACGKSTVGDLLLELGVLDRIDADRIVHDCLQSGTSVTQAVVRRFGDQVLRTDGAVDRTVLGKIVFADPDALRALEAILHPQVTSTIRRRVAALQKTPGFIVIDAVRLLQGDLVSLCDAVWVVECTREVQMERLVGMRHLDPSAAQDRLNAQPTFDHPAVTRVIPNSGSLDDLRRQVHDAWVELGQLRAS